MFQLLILFQSFDAYSKQLRKVVMTISDSEASCKTNNTWTSLDIPMILVYFNHLNDEAIQIFEILWKPWLFSITLNHPKYSSRLEGRTPLKINKTKVVEWKWDETNINGGNEISRNEGNELNCILRGVDTKWKGVEWNGRNEWKCNEMIRKWQETKGYVRKWNGIARKWI